MTDLRLNLCVLISWRGDQKHVSGPMILDDKVEVIALHNSRVMCDTIELSLLTNGGTLWLASYKGGLRTSQSSDFNNYMVMPVSKMKDHLYDLQMKHQKLWEDFERELTDSMILRNSADRSDNPQDIIYAAREKMRTARERYENESRRLFEPGDNSDY